MGSWNSFWWGLKCKGRGQRKREEKAFWPTLPSSFWLPEGGGDEVGREVCGKLGEVEGGDLGELLFDELEGAEVEGLDVGAGLHVGLGDGGAEGGDEGLGLEGVVGRGLFVAVGFGVAAVGEGQDLGLEVEVNVGGVGGASGGVGMGATGAGAVVACVKGGEAEELVGVGGGVGRDHLLFLREGYGDGREGEVVALVGEARVKLVADEGGLELGEGVVAVVGGLRVVVGCAVGAAAGLGVEELVVPDDGVMVRGDAGVGFDGGDEVVEAGFEGGEGVFGTQATASAMALDVEVGGDGWVGLASLGEGLLKQVGAVGDEAIDVEGDELLHLGGVVGGPGNDANAEGVERGNVDLGVGDQQRGVDGRERGQLRGVGESVGLGLRHEGGEGVGCRHGGSLSYGCPGGWENEQRREQSNASEGHPVLLWGVVEDVRVAGAC